MVSVLTSRVGRLTFLAALLAWAEICGEMALLRQTFTLSTAVMFSETKVNKRYTSGNILMLAMTG